MLVCQLHSLVADSRRDHVLLRRVCPSTEQALARTCTRCMQERDTPGAPLAWNLGSRRLVRGARRRPCIGKASLSMLQMIDYWCYTLL